MDYLILKLFHSLKMKMVLHFNLPKASLKSLSPISDDAMPFAGVLISYFNDKILRKTLSFGHLINNLLTIGLNFLN